MSHCKTMYRLGIATLAIITLAAPTAIAMPIDPGSGGTATDPRQKDMHASTVQSPAAQQEHRTPDAVDRSAPKAPAVHQEQRTPDALDRSPAPKAEPLPPGLPTWPVNPQTLPRPQEPAVAPTTGGGDGGGVDWTVPAIALAACLMLGGAFTVARTRLRAARSTAH
jgi:hypothetical protein